ncbi:hypothetical protein QVD17_10856 [Tagetes erecta]|uniref:Uncharacterized protein n=1 Tax=Tagetes erecta TaxID=13708 RepID=A0AAD8P563_TARER|nr:hypothetical protein QVD17_10856 [Tagetes erecta]
MTNATKDLCLRSESVCPVTGRSRRLRSEIFRDDEDYQNLQSVTNSSFWLRLAVVQLIRKVKDEEEQYQKLKKTDPALSSSSLADLWFEWITN